MKLPAITISGKDRERLISVAAAAMSSVRPVHGASMLLSEIGRATVVESLPKGVVTVHSDVELRDNVHKTVKRVRLVYPDEAVTGASSVSVLTPLGAALIGLSEGDSISWCTRTGDLRSVTVLRASSGLAANALRN
jgi:regulator of nucleoside diphosphate kinase